MADGVGVLPFVRGIDLSKNDFHSSFPSRITSMTNLRWLRVDRSNLTKVPPEIGNLTKLEHLSLVKNNLNSLQINVENLPNLKVINVRHNNLKNASIPDEVFALDDLLTVDLSHNDIIEIPEELENASELLVLNLSNNRVTQIPNQLFMHLTDLIFMDVSNNLLETIPPQLRRLTNLQTLILNNNPLLHAQLRQLPSLTQLHTLHLRNTQRTISNMPNKLDNIETLTDLDISHNDLPRVPEPVYRMTNLKRLDLSHNTITELSSLIDSWTKLETLNLSRNQLTALPHTICKMTSLKRLYANSNNLTFEGIPLGIGKLLNLEVFMAAWNKLECIPEGVCRCMKLKKLVLHSNCLITLPEGIHFLANLENLDTRNNPKLVMPPKPVSQSEADAEFYNIDFSYQTQLRLAAGQSPSVLQTKDPIARKMRLRGRRYQSVNETDKKLKGMVESAEERKHKKIRKDGDDDGSPDDHKLKTGKRWDQKLVKPDLNYQDIFLEDVGTDEGLTVWVIENFLPTPMEEGLFGKFYDGDCYIILKTEYDETDQLFHKIYYWIGQHCTLDKKACAAIHAVNLRNLLGAEGRTMREEQSDESDEFLELFDTGVSYIEGGNSSGFYSVEETVYTTRLYRLYGGHGIKVEPVELTWESLDPNYVFVCDAGLKVYVWSGSKAKLMFRTKGRLFADKIMKMERKNKGEIVQIFEDEIEEFMGFWDLLGGPPTGRLREKYEYKYFTPKQPILYKVGLGMGYLELPQVELPDNKLKQSLLDTKSVYVLDCWSDVFIWIGRRSARLVRAAALKLAQELSEFLPRPAFSLVTRNLEGVEQSVFKTKFAGWDDVLAVDFTKTADRVAQIKKESDANAGKSEDSVVPNLPPPKVQKVDLAALFTARQLPMSDQECDQSSEEWNEDLDQMECFVLEGRKFVRLPEEEIGHFRSGDCYVFLCRYWVPPEENEDEEAEEEEEKEDDFQCVVYFWEGRDAGKMGWLTFAFSLQKKFEALFGDKLEVVRTRQQQEALKFLSHFKGRFVVEKGKRKHSEAEAKSKLFEIRSTMGKLTRRAMEVECDATNLNTNFPYVLKVPFDNAGGIVYVWLGKKCDQEQFSHAEEIGNELAEEGYSLQVVQEGEEPENFFWVGIGGKKEIAQTAEYADNARLFRCSNEKGFFTVSEKCSDFCQDDLADDDVMLLDTGTELFIWIGETASDIEKKLSVKAAQVYMQHIKEQKLGPQRKLHLTGKRKEPIIFSRCFHGWSEWPAK
ncbi:protein flightless-1 homolog [Hydractinia symbiolongicarpus]|uniref:protein flightless-1 homolog n=1 Tax=Hydractinia symbiolongicarpus TaxID=13093 RepID=UPI00254A42BD|nr:protein flightless-1 homolog [Hydractinia symbiolongicarpus]